MSIQDMIKRGMVGQKKWRSLSLDFTALGTGGMVGLIGSTWTRSASGAVNTPTVGAELVVNGGFDSNTASWDSVAGATLSSISGGQDGNCLEVRCTGTISPNARQQITSETDSWYLCSGYHKNGTNVGFLRFASTSTGNDLYDSGSISDATWVNRLGTFRSIGTSVYVRLLMSGSTTDNTTLFDTVSLKKITLNTLFAWKKFSTQYGIAEAGYNIVAKTPAGVYMNLDAPNNPQNMVTALHNGTNLILSKRVNGTVTELINTAATYVAGALVEIRRAAGTNTYQAFYNGSQVGTDQTISDASIINNKYHGIMSTHSQNQCLNFSFVGA